MSASAKTLPTVPHIASVTPGGPSAATSVPSMLLNLDEAARELRCTRRSLERQIAAHRLAVVHIGRSVRIERSELENYLVRLRQEEQAPGGAKPRDDRGSAT